MEKPEITAGMKNALSRGYSLEQAKKTFINSGYSSADVEDSARSFSGIISNIPQRTMLPNLPLPPNMPATQQEPILPELPAIQPKQQQTQTYPLFQTSQQLQQNLQPKINKLQTASQQQTSAQKPAQVPPYQQAVRDYQQQNPAQSSQQQYFKLENQQKREPKSVFWIVVTIILLMILVVLFCFLIMEIFFREKLIELLPFLERFG